MAALQLLALLVILGVATAQNVTGGCNTVQFQLCRVQAFQEFLQVSTKPDVINKIFADYTILNSFLLQQWTGPDGFGLLDSIVKSCNGLSQFYGCMLNNMGCLQLKNLLADPAVDAGSVYAVRGTLDEYDFNCGPGINGILRDLPCIQQTIFASSDALQACTRSYLSNVLHDSTRACHHRNVLALCYSAPFHLSSCRRDQGMDLWWACTSQKRFGQPQFPNCDSEVKCGLQGPFGLAEHIAEHHSIDADGAHLFRAPDHYELVDGVKTLVKGEVTKVAHL